MAKHIHVHLNGKAKDATSGSSIARDIARDVATCGQRCVRAKIAFKEEGDGSSADKIRKAEEFLDKAYDILRSL